MDVGRRSLRHLGAYSEYLNKSDRERGFDLYLTNPGNIRKIKYLGWFATRRGAEAEARRLAAGGIEFKNHKKPAPKMEKKPFKSRKK